MENLNTKIGLVGLGIIGSSILKNIHSAGQKSSGFDIDENSTRTQLSTENQIHHGIKSIPKIRRNVKRPRFDISQKLEQ